MTAVPVLQLRFTPEELVVLLQYLVESDENIPYEDILPDYTEAQRDIATNVARRGLIARDVLEVGENGGYSIVPLVAVVVGGSMLPSRRINIVRQKSGEAVRSVSFYELETELLGSQQVTADDLYEYILFADETAYQQGILMVLGIDESVACPCPAGQLPAVILQRAMEVAQSGSSAEIAAELSQSALPEETARYLVSTLSEPFEVKTIFKQHPDGTETPAAELVTFLQGSEHLWQLNGVQDNGTGPITISPLSGEKAEKEIASFLDFTIELEK